MDPVDLERLIDRALKTLPAPHPPETLVAKVMASVGAQPARRWYVMPWYTWPGAWRAAFVAGALALLAGGVLAMPSLHEVLAWMGTAASAHVPADVHSGAGRVMDTLEEAQTTAVALGTAWRIVCAPLVLYAMVILVLLCATCAAFASAIAHLGSRKALSQ
jgi:hypothetical protein